MARPLSYTPETGQVLTLDDLSAFLADAYGKGFPGRQQVRFMGAIEVNLHHGPRATRITVIPDEVSDGE
jgi:hypothetical protein